MERHNACAGSWPNDPLFKHLLEQREKVKHTIIRDTKFGHEANYDRFLRDVLTAQKILHEKLPGDAIDSRGCIVEDTVVGILSTGYELVVAFYAILALGGIAFLAPQEFSMDQNYPFMRKVGSYTVVVGQENPDKDIGPEGEDIFGVPIEISTKTINEYNCNPQNIPKEMDFINRDAHFSSKRPAVILLTSSTSGAPKCVLLPRAMLYQLDKPFRSSTDVTLCTRLPQRCTGLLDVTDMIYVGGCAEIPDFDKLHASAVWDRLRRGGVNVLPAAPGLLTSMENHFRGCLSDLSQEERACYTHAIADIRVIWTGGQALAAPVKRFWRDIRDGKPFMFAYGSTELGGLIFWNDISQTNEIRKTSMGTPVTATEVKLSGGDRGELLLRSESMFLRYVGEPEVTEQAFDENGFFKTSDLVHLNGGRYTLKGRAFDFVEAIDGSMISLPDIMESIQDLPYLDEAYAVAIPSVTGHQIATLVRLKKLDAVENHISIERIRTDLSAELRECELPTRLRFLEEHEPSPPCGLRRKVPTSEVLESYFTEKG